MELQLQNFRCFKSKEITFPEKGLVLLSAPSGSGKSTVLNGLLWALYGEVKKPQSFGARSCSVSVSLSDHYGISVRRQAGPGRLVVLDHKNKDQEYEGETAQEIINKRVGNPKEFLASSYVIQNLDSSVLTLTPGEQLAFIENLSLDKEAIEKERQNLKKHIASLDVQRVELNTKTNYAKNLLEEFVGLKEPSCDFSDTKNEDVEEAIEKLREKKEEYSDALKILEEAKKKKQSTLLSLERLEGEKKSLNVENKVEKSHIRVLEKKRDSAKAFEQLCERAEERKKYDEFMSQRPEPLDSVEVQKLEDRKKALKKAKKNFLDFQVKKKDIDKKLKGLSQEIRKLFPTKCETSVSSLAKHLNKKIGSLSQEITEKEKRVENLSEDKTKAELEKNLLVCPCCEESLVFVSGTLQKSGQSKSNLDLEKITETLKEKKKELASMKKNLETAKSFSHRLSECVLTESFPEFLGDEELNTISERLEQNEKSELPKWIVELGKKTKPLTEEERETLSEEFAYSLKEVQRELDRAKDKFKEQTRVLQKLSDVESRISKLRKTLEDGDIEEFQKVCDVLKAQVGTVEEETAKMQKSLAFAVEWRTFSEKKERKDKLLLEISEFSKELTKVEKQMKDALLLKEKSRAASFMAVEKTLNAINYTAKTHLSKLFLDDPISIVLKTSKETKKGKKVQMSTCIQYKGHEYDSFWSLSGGERQKACLSFILAINEVVGARFLLLDEALAQLHREVNTDILEYLRDDIASNRLVVVVSHEANRGIFHKVIEI
ncbi:putative ATPase [Brazilian marseillevirus]|uniref:putative ATPase n=1 Tax=Brazilian marseillevirus TaxID=1813599 RepID=UPI00078356AA|nr:putative ATPase [Brazilian marseillevirus]AMQ10619.1 putative ATPase [Brazilian marseillevirus]